LHGFYNREGIEDGIAMAEFSVDPPDSDLDLEYDPRLNVFIQWGTGPWKGVTEVLKDIRNAVGRVVSEMETLP
jgi:hypothetical protein